jgi:hypothetical protein
LRRPDTAISLKLQWLSLPQLRELAVLVGVAPVGAASALRTHLEQAAPGQEVDDYIFFRDHPFDLKVTYLPRNYDPQEAVRDPKRLATWMYENQGAQRFGADNRMFIVLLDSNNTSESWRLKRGFGLVFGGIDEFLDEEGVSEADRVDFRFDGAQYSALSKVLIIHR